MDRPRFITSSATELVGMHPQTLRMYEQKCLVQPQRAAAANAHGRVKS